MYILFRKKEKRRKGAVDGGDEMKKFPKNTIRGLFSRNLRSLYILKVLEIQI